MEDEVSIFDQDYLAVKIARNPESGRFQSMSIALSKDVASKIEIIKKDRQMTFEKRQKFIDDILNETNCCEGYFFNQELGMNYRCLYLEHCLGNLDSYIHEQTTGDDFKWTVLPQLCSQLVDSIAWLHHRNIFHDGNLNPRYVLVKVSENDTTKLKLFVPDSLNSFNMLDIKYSKSWSIDFRRSLQLSPDEKSIRKDLSSVAILVYFIQTLGSHPFQLDPQYRNDFTAIGNNIKDVLWEVNDQEALSKSCFCLQGSPCTEVIACKYRVWVNSLAQDLTENLLKELVNSPAQSYTNTSSEKLMEHPFFWNTARILLFIEKSYDYLKEANNITTKQKFGWTPNQRKILPARRSNNARPIWDIVGVCFSLRTDYKNIIDFLHEKISYQNGAKVLIPMTNDVDNFYLLLQQIRNKSCHWNELTPASTGTRNDLGQISFLTSHNNHQMEVYPTKYCLFWMVHFPLLLLYTWKELKDFVKLG